MGGRNKHVPKTAGTVQARKMVPGAAARATATLLPPTGTLTVRWTKFDYEGPFCLGRSTIQAVVQMLKQVSHLESMTPFEIFRPNSSGKDYGDPAGLPNSAAVKRLEELRLQDETNISRLSFSGTQRLYGFRRDHDFYAIFWDPDHEIWPSKLKHT